MGRIKQRFHADAALAAALQMTLPALPVKCTRRSLPISAQAHFSRTPPTSSPAQGHHSDCHASPLPSPHSSSSQKRRTSAEQARKSVRSRRTSSARSFTTRPSSSTQGADTWPMLSSCAGQTERGSRGQQATDRTQEPNTQLKHACCRGTAWGCSPLKGIHAMYGAGRRLAGSATERTTIKQGMCSLCSLRLSAPGRQLGKCTKFSTAI